MGRETLSKLYLELDQVVPSGTKTERVLGLEAKVAELETENAALKAAAAPRSMSEAPRDGSDIYLIHPATFENCYKVGVGTIVTRRGRWGKKDGWWYGEGGYGLKPIGFWPIPTTSDAQIKALFADTAK